MHWKQSHYGVDNLPFCEDQLDFMNTFRMTSQDLGRGLEVEEVLLQLHVSSRNQCLAFYKAFRRCAFAERTRPG